MHRGVGRSAYPFGGMRCAVQRGGAGGLVPRVGGGVILRYLETKGDVDDIGATPAREQLEFGLAALVVPLLGMAAHPTGSPVGGVLLHLRPLQAEVLGLPAATASSPPYTPLYTPPHPVIEGPLPEKGGALGKRCR